MIPCLRHNERVIPFRPRQQETAVLTIDTGIKQVVRERYASAAVAKTSCCGPKSCADAAGPDLALNMIGDAYADVDG